MFFAGVVVVLRLSAVDQHLHPVDVEPVGALHLHFEEELAVCPVMTTGENAAVGFHFEEGP